MASSGSVCPRTRASPNPTRDFKKADRQSLDGGDCLPDGANVEFFAPAPQEQAMSRTKPDRPGLPGKPDDPRPDEHYGLGELGTLVDPQDPPDPAEASDPETVANSNANR